MFIRLFVGNTVFLCVLVLFLEGFCLLLLRFVGFAILVVVSLVVIRLNCMVFSSLRVGVFASSLKFML